MGFEVELKFRVDGSTERRESLAARLSEIGAVAEGTLEHSDLYLRHPSRDFAVTNEAFRLRGEGSRNLLTYKGPRRAGPAKTREEIEIPFADGPDERQAMTTLMARLGFEPVAEVRKTRQAFAIRSDDRDVHVALDDAGPLGFFVEVETLAADESDLADAQAAVLRLAQRLDLRDVEPRSYLRMLLESQAASS